MQAPAPHFACGVIDEDDAMVPLLFVVTTGVFGVVAGPTDFILVEIGGAIVTALFTGTTGEFCLVAPPTTTGFFGPPKAVWAEAGTVTAHAPSTISLIMVRFFMNAFPV